MSDSKQQWLKVGLIKKSNSGSQYLALGTPKSGFRPCQVELVVKDMDGKVLARVDNPTLNIQNPRKRKDITEEQLAKIPDFILAEISLAPKTG